MNGTTTQTAMATSGTKLIDEFLRRELRVGDPRNASEVAAALRQRYATEAGRLDQEAAGVPMALGSPALPPPEVADAETPGSRQAKRVGDNLDADLGALIDDASNREWKPELTGWRNTLLREYADGQAAAAFARDVAERDRGFICIRRLSEFGRVARLTSILSDQGEFLYRRLASTLDDACAVIRTLMGEALFRAGLSDGGMMSEFPVTDARQRRDAVIMALRRFTGLGQDADEWGDSAASYRLLFDRLEQASASDLRVYLRESSLSATLDGLLADASRQDPDSLRQLAATSPVELTRLTHLLRIAASVDRRARPELSNFVQQLRLFLEAFGVRADGFKMRAGARLIDLAVPLSMAAQQTDEADGPARGKLRDVVAWRYDFAREVDCYIRCCSDDVAELRQRVKLDRALYDADRIIDLYAQGEGKPPAWGDEEKRAAVYARLLLNQVDGVIASVQPQPAALVALRARLANIRLDEMLPNNPNAISAAEYQRIVSQVVHQEARNELRWRDLARSLADRCDDLNP